MSRRILRTLQNSGNGVKKYLKCREVYGYPNAMVFTKLTKMVKMIKEERAPNCPT